MKRSPAGIFGKGVWRPCVVLTSVLLACASLAPPAFAQDDEQTLDEIIVTARFREENLQSTPLAITAVTGETLDVRGLGELEDVGAVIPNSFIRRQGMQNGPAPVIGIRGVITSDFSFANEPGVAVYIDDAYFGTLLGSSMELLDLERMEILRGPQGTLFGKNALGGAIRAVSRKPQGDNTGYLQVTYGAYDRLDFKGAYDYALIEDTLFLRVTGLANHRDGYQDVVDFTCDMISRGTPQLAGIGDGRGADGSAGAGLDGHFDVVPVGSTADNNFFLPQQKLGLSPGNCKVGTAGGEDVQAGRVMLRFVGSDRLEVNLSGDYTDDTSEPQPDDLFFLPAGPPVTMDVLGLVYNMTGPAWAVGAMGVVLPGFPNYVDLNFGIPYDSRFLTHDPEKTYSTWVDNVNNLTFPAKSAIESWGVSGVIDYDVTDDIHAKWVAAYREYDSEFTDDRDHSPIWVHGVYTLAEHEQFNTELQLSGLLFNERLNWTVGGFYYDAETFWGGAPRLLDSLGGFTHNDTAQTENYSGFVHLVFDITDELSITAGGRYSDESKDYHFDHSPAVPPADAATSESRFDWKVGIDYDVSDDLLIYGQVATGFRSEAFNVRIFTPQQLTVPIPTEELTSYEIGAKGDFFDRRLRMNIAAFYSDYESRNIGANATQCAEQFPEPVLGGFGLTCPGADGVLGTADDRPPALYGPGDSANWFANINTPAEFWGVELELQARPLDALMLDATVGWNDLSADDIHPDNRLQPEWNASAGAQYEFVLGNGATITPRIDMFYQGPVNSANNLATPPDSLNLGSSAAPVFVPPGFDTIGGHMWLNGRITYETADGNWALSLSATNLTDKFYYESFWGSGTEFRTGAPNRPFEWAITLRRNFN